MFQTTQPVCHGIGYQLQISTEFIYYICGFIIFLLCIMCVCMYECFFCVPLLLLVGSHYLWLVLQ